MIGLRDLLSVYRYFNNNDSNCFASFLRRLMGNEGIFTRFFTAIASEFRYLLRSDIRRAFRFRISRSATLMIYFRFDRVQMVQRVAFGVFQATRYIRMYRSNVAFGLSQVLRTRVSQVNVRARSLLLSFFQFFKRVSAITR